MVLRSRGYVVEEAYSPKEAFLAVHSDVIDLLLICHTVPASDRENLIASVRSVRRLLPILCITDQDFARSTEGCFTVTNSPLDLLDAVLSAATASTLETGTHGT
jgi:PleD family two-component response regulator